MNNEEAAVVLRGRPTVGTPEGKRVLEPGDVAFFAAGPDGAHRLFNASDEPARCLITAGHASPEVVEHSDSGKVLALSRRGPLWSMHRRDEYVDGEEPRL